ncbi:MAG: VPLPA-CTERM sorting domain-containing protein [Pseudomonadota bacterium]
MTDNADFAVNGSALDVNPTDTNSAAFIWDLVGPGSRGDLTITVDVNFSQLSGDNDPSFLITDQTNILGFERADNGSGSFFARQGTFDPESNPPFQLVPGTNGIGNVNPLSFSYVLTILDEEGGTTGTVSEAGNDFDFNFTTALDSDSALSFAFVSQGSNESYQINSIGITIDGDESPTATIPLPATAWLLGMGLLGFGALARRRKRPV